MCGSRARRGRGRSSSSRCRRRGQRRPHDGGARVGFSRKWGCHASGDRRRVSRMPTHLEVSLERDIERIRNQVTEMGALAEEALQDCVKAMTTGDRQLAYAVILRDHYIDEKE